MGVFLFIAWSAIYHQAWAADGDAGTSGFQRYFANMRVCLASEDVGSCLPSKVDDVVRKPADDYSRDQFVDLVISNPEFRGQVSSCFAESAQVLADWGSEKLFRSAEYACEARKTNGLWKLAAFYDFFSQE